MKQAFDQSVADGKPWQIWIANTMMGPYLLPDMSKYYLLFPQSLQPQIQGYFDIVFNQTSALALKGIAALLAVQLEWNKDDYW